MALQHRHRLVVYTASGTRIADLSGTANGGYIRLSSAVQMNSAGILYFNLLADNPVIPLMDNDAQVEHWRDDTLLFRGLYQAPGQYVVDQRNIEIFTATCYGENDLLNRAVIAWADQIDNRTMFTEMPAESIMHTLVKYNATSHATTENGRKVSFGTPRITVNDASDIGRGNSISRLNMSGKSLLAELQEIARDGEIDFKLVKTGPRTWEFRALPRSATPVITFSRSRHTMGQLAYNAVMQDPRSVIIVGGNGEGTEREFVVRYGPDYTEDNHREYFQSFTGENATTVALQAEGDTVAQEKRIQSAFTFQPLHSGDVEFGVDYTLGDIVAGAYRDITALFQVTGYSLSVDVSQGEDIQLELTQQV